MCSLSQSISLRAEKENSSISEWAMVLAESLSSATQDVDPTVARGAPRIAIVEVGDSVDGRDSTEKQRGREVERERERERARGKKIKTETALGD